MWLVHVQGVGVGMVVVVVGGRGGTQENISYMLVVQLSVLGLCIRVGGRGYQADMGLLLNLLTHQFTGQLPLMFFFFWGGGGKGS